MPLFCHPIVTRTGLLPVLAVLVALPALAQNAPEYWVNPDYTVRQWTVLDGLPSNTINAFTQSSDGYLWMGTNEGLVRRRSRACHSGPVR